MKSSRRARIKSERKVVKVILNKDIVWADEVLPREEHFRQKRGHEKDREKKSL